MASGYQVATINTIAATKTAFAQPSAIESSCTMGGATIVQPTPCWDFQSTATDEFLLLFCRLLEEYDGGGLNLILPWISTVTSGSVRWAASIRRMDYEAEDVDAAFNYDTNVQAVTSAAPATAGFVKKAIIPFSSGSQMDSLAAGELFTLMIRRDQAAATGGTDDMAADARLLAWGVHVLEQ